MRKRTVTHVAKTVFWYVLYFLPVMAFLIYLFVNPLQLNQDNTDSPEMSQPYKVITFEKGLSVSNVERYIGNNALSSSGISYFELQIMTYDNIADELYRYKIPCVLVFKNYYNEFLPSLNALVFDLNCTLTEDFNVTVPATFNYEFETNIFMVDSSERNYYFNFPLNEPITYYSVEKVDYNFESFINRLGFEFATDNVIVNTLHDLFGSEGVLPLFHGREVFIIFSWYICVFLCHLAVDVLLFIPAFAHKWMKEFVGD